MGCQMLVRVTEHLMNGNMQLIKEQIVKRKLLCQLMETSEA